MSYDFRAWKKRKIERGEWLPKEEYLKSKKIILEAFKDYKDLLKDIPKDIERLVVLDTETTGLAYNDRIIEISIIEIKKGEITDNIYHSYFNPQKTINPEALKVHGIEDKFLEDKPLFKDKIEEIFKFIQHSKIIAHNSNFDMRMLNYELKLAQYKPYPREVFIDTLKIAKYLFPDKKCNLDSLCQRFDISSERLEGGKHSAVEDTKILCKVYKKLEALLKDKKLNIFDFC